MSNIITESGMDFIADNVFHIERTDTFANFSDGVKSVEFVRSMNNKLLFIEAKSSFPNPKNETPNPEKDGKTGSELFHEAITDIFEKFIHSLSHYSALDVGVIGDGFPQEYTPPNKASLVFALVINGFDKTWCVEVKKALTNRMRKSIPISKIWNPKIIVINDEAATNQKLIAN